MASLKLGAAIPNYLSFWYPEKRGSMCYSVFCTAKDYPYGKLSILGNIEWGFFKLFEVSGERLRTMLGCGGKRTLFSLVPDIDYPLENLRQDWKFFIVVLAIWVLPKWLVGFSSPRTFHLHFLPVYNEWCDGHQGHTVPWILMEHPPLDSYNSHVEPWCQRIQILF